MMEMDYFLAHELWEYDDETGKFYWRKTEGRTRRGEEAGSILPHGYMYVHYKKKAFMAHRVAWLMVTGSWPENYIDHINGDRADNRISNLREATPQQNQANRGVSKRNRLGVKGVYLNNGKYLTNIKVNGKVEHLGYFNDIKSAKDAYDAAARRIYGEYARNG